MTNEEQAILREELRQRLAAFAKTPLGAVVRSLGRMLGKCEVERREATLGDVAEALKEAHEASSGGPDTERQPRGGADK